MLLSSRPSRTMQIKVINPTNVVIGVLFPPTKAEKNDLTQIHSTIVGRFDHYDNYQFIPPAGARISQEGISEILIQPDRVQFIEEIKAAPFQSIKEKAVEIFRIVFSRIKPPVFLVLGIKLVALVDLHGENAAVDFINGKIMPSIKPEHLGVLGPTVVGTGVRIHMQRDLAATTQVPQPTKCTYDLRIEPFFREKSKLYVELDSQFPGLVPRLDMLENRIELVSGYLKDEVKDFLNQFS